ncbi:MAG: hypothetical protein AAGI08_18300 [Bacteroidota bacterium]
MRNLLFALALSGLVGGHAVAQSSSSTTTFVRTIVVSDDSIFVDGRHVPQPAGLQLNGIRQEFRFEGVDRPSIFLSGQPFTLEGATLRPLRFPSASDAYLNVLRRQDTGLVSRLQRERRMENQARMLARRVRTTRDAARRARLNEDLRAKLAEIFELKQQNRRDEIARLEARLAEIKETLQIRERMKTIMIETRAEELVAE